MDDGFSLAKTVCTGKGGIIKWDMDFMDDRIPLVKTVCTGKGGSLGGSGCKQLEFSRPLAIGTERGLSLNAIVCTTPRSVFFFNVYPFSSHDLLLVPITTWTGMLPTARASTWMSDSVLLDVRGLLA